LNASNDASRPAGRPSTCGTSRAPAAFARALRASTSRHCSGFAWIWTVENVNAAPVARLISR
jgi:hypothetical protein